MHNEGKDTSIRRGKIDSICDVIKVINDGTCMPTHIMYKANLSWKPLKIILANLVAKGIVTKTPCGQGDERRRATYTLSSRGMKIVKKLLDPDDIGGLLE